MIKNSILRLFLVGLLILSTSYCSSTDTKEEETPPDTEETTEKKEEPVVDSKEEEPKEEKSMLDRAMDAVPVDKLLEEFNEKLAEIRYPDGNSIEGFEYKKWEIPNRKDFIKWLKESGKIINEALDKLPESIKLEITGHADTTGPENKDGGRLGNVYYSTKRAEEVKSLIVKVLPENDEAKKKLEARLVTRGAGSSEPISGIDGDSPKNRRVTFKLIQADSEGSESSSDTTESGSETTESGSDDTSESGSEDTDTIDPTKEGDK
ncbi:MAG: OmpA family protein [Leptospiraceae bacterium]|nr:OmpA family protein [Leptospiraceae bacterium]